MPNYILELSQICQLGKKLTNSHSAQSNNYLLQLIQLYLKGAFDP